MSAKDRSFSFGDVDTGLSPLDALRHSDHRISVRCLTAQGRRESLGPLPHAALGVGCLTSRLDVCTSPSLSCSGHGSPCMVRLKNGVIQWVVLPKARRSSSPMPDRRLETLLDSANSLPLDLVIAVKPILKTSKLTGHEDTVGFIVYGAQVQKQSRGGTLLSPFTVQFTRGSNPVYEEWLGCLRNALEIAGNRPQKLLFFINPMAGKGEAALVYQQTVRPLLKATGIESDVMLLSGPGSMKKHLSDSSILGQYDGLVAVGGDGTLNELINISVLKSIECLVGNHFSVPTLDEEDEEIPVHRLTVEQVCAKQLRLGVIPAGSVNHIATSVFGSDSPMVATLHTLLGGSLPMNLCALSSHKRFIRFGTTAVFSSQRVLARSPRASRRKLLRLSSTQTANVAKHEREW